MKRRRLQFALLVLLIISSPAWAQERRARIRVLAMPAPAVMLVDADFASLTPLPEPTVLSEMRVRARRCRNRGARKSA